MKRKFLQLLQNNLNVQRQVDIRSEGSEATIYLYDVIDRWFGVSAEQMVQSINKLDCEVIHLRVNSPGGDVFEARAIKTALEQHSAKVIAHIDGLAASAATFLSLAADEVEMSEGGFFMIHNAWSFTIGNKHDHNDTAALLDKVDASIVSDYAKRTGASKEEIQSWMDAETWFTAEEAKDRGFIDRIAQGEKTENRFDVSAYDNAPDALLTPENPVEALEPDWEMASRRLSLVERRA